MKIRFHRATEFESEYSRVYRPTRHKTYVILEEVIAANHSTDTDKQNNSGKYIN